MNTAQYRFYNGTGRIRIVCKHNITSCHRIESKMCSSSCCIRASQSCGYGTRFNSMRITVQPLLSLPCTSHGYHSTQPNQWPQGAWDEMNELSVLESWLQLYHTADKASGFEWTQPSWFANTSWLEPRMLSSRFVGVLRVANTSAGVRIFRLPVGSNNAS